MNPVLMIFHPSLFAFIWVSKSSQFHLKFLFYQESKVKTNATIKQALYIALKARWSISKGFGLLNWGSTYLRQESCWKPLAGCWKSWQCPIFLQPLPCHTIPPNLLCSIQKVSDKDAEGVSPFIHLVQNFIFCTCSRRVFSRDLPKLSYLELF